MPKPIDWEDEIHIRLQPQCGACLEPLENDDRIVALIVRNGFLEAHDAHKPTSHGYCLQGSDRGALFCKFPACNRCSSSNGFESATIHMDCLSLFSKNCTAKDKYRRLWAASLAMVPWRVGSSLLISPEKSFARDRDITFANDALGTNMLSRLPPEVTCMVLELLGPHAIRRYSAAVERAEMLSVQQSTNQSPTQTLELANIQSWQRDFSSVPVVCRNLPNAPPYVRVCIDSDGIYQIERISNSTTSHKQYNSLRRDQLYIVEHVDRLTRVTARFEYGYCRLTIPEKVSLAIWNEPTPPYFPLPKPGLGNALRLERCRHFLSMDMNRCFGITFFYLGSSLTAIHGHDVHTPTARETFRRLSLHQQSRVVWIYVPLVKGCKIIEFCKRTFTKRLFNIILKTQLQPPRELGHFHNGAFTDDIYTVSPSWRLVHEPATFAICPYIEANCHGCLPPQPSRREEDIILTDAHVASAALENVTSASIFVAAESGLCMGIILEYTNGVRTSLGQCRLGVDKCTTVKCPTQLWSAVADFRCPKARRTYTGLVIRWCDSGGREHTEITGLCVRNWSRQDMVGSMQFWFNDMSTKLRFVS